DAVALRVLDRETFEHDVVGGDEKALARARLPLEGEHGFLRTRAADRHAVRVEHETVGEIPAPGIEQDRVALLHHDEGLDELFRAVFGGEPDLGGMGEPRAEDADGEGERARRKVQSHLLLPRAKTESPDRKLPGTADDKMP